MKKKKAFLSIIIIGFISILNAINSYAISFNIDVIGPKKLGLDKTFQLRAEYWVGNDMMIDNDPSSLGERSREDVTEKVIWETSNASIAEVDEKGKITGKGKGKVTITATDKENEYVFGTIEIEIVDPNEVEEYKLEIKHPSNAPVFPGDEEEYLLDLINISNSIYSHIKYSIEDESIAKILYKAGSNTDDYIHITVKALKAGKTKLKAEVEFNGQTFTALYEISVSEQKNKLVIVKDNDEDVQEGMTVGQSVQLKAILEHDGTSTDVTKQVVWSSSNTYVAGVGKTNGKLIVYHDGKATITAEYKENGETVTKSIDIQVTSLPVQPADPKEEPKPDEPEPEKPEPNAPEPDPNDPTPTDKPIPDAGANTLFVIIVAMASIAALTVYIRYKIDDESE